MTGTRIQVRIKTRPTRKCTGVCLELKIGEAAINALMRMKGQPAKLNLLIFDELGYVPASKPGSELSFAVISAAYERTSVIVKTNLPLEQWFEVLARKPLHVMPKAFVAVDEILRTVVECQTIFRPPDCNSASNSPALSGDGSGHP